MRAKLVLHRSKKRKVDSRHPVVVRLTHSRDYKDVATGYYYHLAEWDIPQNLPKKVSAKVKKDLGRIVREYEDAIAGYEGADVSFDIIKDEVKGVKKSAPSVLAYFDIIVNRFAKAGQIKTSTTYAGVKKNIEAFIDGNYLTKQLRFAEITVSFLNDYKTWLDGEHSQTLKNGTVKTWTISDTTKHIYIRTLRSVYNKAIDDSFANKAKYPFETFFKDKHFAMESKKKAITSTDIAKIAALELEPSSMKHEAQMYFLFGYYGMGINFVDMAHLKWSNIDNGNINFKRSKLKRKKSKQKTFSIPVKGVIKEVLSYYRPLTGISKDNYIFEILDKSFIAPAEIQSRITSVITRVNRDLKRIGKLAKVEKSISTYTWRHSAFSVLKLERDIPIAMISQAAGHSSVAVTEIYLDSFGTDSEQELYEVL